MHRILGLKEISDIIILFFLFELETVPFSFRETTLTSLKSLA